MDVEVDGEGKSTNETMATVSPVEVDEEGDCVFTSEFWAKHYRESGAAPFDWYQNYSTLRSHLLDIMETVKRSAEICFTGCGTSTLPAHLYDEGFKNITCIDKCEYVTFEMARRNHTLRPSMEYLHLDATAMARIPDKAFEVVIDKALLDALLCGPACFDQSRAYLSEVRRVLRDDGIFICISHGIPATRVDFLMDNAGTVHRPWQLSIHELPKPAVHHCSKDDNDGGVVGHFLYLCTL